MAEEIIKDENYINIQGWMVNRLGLKNTELIVYACIYGFSQDGEGKYRGGLNYLQTWSSATKPTVIKALKTLEEKDLIIKKEIEISKNIRLNEYTVNLEGRLKNFTGGKEILPNNKNNNILDNNINIIIEYLNLLLGSKFLPGVKKTRQAITARLNEGYTVDDFKTVIEYKYNEWIDDEKMKYYLTPDTLFRPANFEKYYNAALLYGKKVTKTKQEVKEVETEGIDYSKYWDDPNVWNDDFKVCLE